MLDANRLIGMIGDACASRAVDDEDGIGVPIRLMVHGDEYEIADVAASDGAVLIVVGDVHE